MSSARPELHQRLNAQGNDKADHNTHKGFPKITPEHDSQVAALVIGKAEFKFLLFDSKRNFTAANQSEKHPGGAEGKGRQERLIEQAQPEEEIDHGRRAQV